MVEGLTQQSRGDGPVVGSVTSRGADVMVRDERGGLGDGPQPHAKEQVPDGAGQTAANRGAGLEVLPLCPRNRLGRIRSPAPRSCLCRRGVQNP